MKIKVCIRAIHTDGTKYENKAFDCPSTLIEQYGESKLSISELPIEYFQLENNYVFSYIDDLAQRVSKRSHELEWDWRGIRKGAEYYLQFDVTALIDSVERFYQTFKAVFLYELQSTDPFDLPKVDAPFVFDSLQEWNENDEDEYIEYDEDERLRLLEELTVDNQYIQWERNSPENNAAGDLFSFIGAGAGVASFVYTFINDFEKYKKQQHYARKIKELRDIIVEKYDNKGRFISPPPKAPNVYNAEFDEYEYVFTQITDDGRKYKTYIDAEGKNITRIPEMKG